MSTAADVLVLGGGLVGLASAHALARAGFSVTLLEQSVPSASASSAAAGMLAPLGDATGALVPIAREARDGWTVWREAIQTESGLPIEMDTDGALLIALTDTDDAGLERIREQAAALGETIEEIEVGAVRKRVPDLNPSLRRAMVLPDERRVDNVAALAALARAAAVTGVRLLAGFDVMRIEFGATGVRAVARNGQTADGDRLILAAGVGSAAFLGLPPLPVRPVRGQMLRLEGVDWSWDGIVRRPDGYSVRRGPASLLVGATVEPDAGHDTRNSVEGIGSLLDWTCTTFPTLAVKPLSATWAGLRPGTPDQLPILGPFAEAPRVIAATGHYRNGVLLAPWTADVVVETVKTGRLPERAQAFDVRRFRAPGAFPAVPP